MSLFRETSSVSKNIERIGEIMAYEISKTSRTRRLVETPLDVADVNVMDEEIVIATIPVRACLFIMACLITLTVPRTRLFRPTGSTKRPGINHLIYNRVYCFPFDRGKTLIVTDPCWQRKQHGAHVPGSSHQGNPSHIHIATIIASQPAIEITRKISRPIKPRYGRRL